MAVSSCGLLIGELLCSSSRLIPSLNLDNAVSFAKVCACTNSLLSAESSDDERERTEDLSGA